MHHLHEFLPLAVAAINLITALINQRPARRRAEQPGRLASANQDIPNNTKRR
ncbi:hypothetical protein ACFFR3_35195 [Nonomuraea salmonea]|uniref:Uncharacterized protein n=1 Tax=Nonomuraea salmonea TaxID=46181 RepID=A0ABV5NWS0_9ACTN